MRSACSAALGEALLKHCKEYYIFSMTHALEHSPQAFLNDALRFIERSRKAILDISKTSFRAELKDDNSYLTAADTMAERVLREAIQARFPQHEILGEEFAGQEDSAGYLWTIDPIDGTQNFVHGIPTYGTILSLRHEGQAIVGVVDHPAMGLTYYGAKGCGAFCNGERIHIVDSLLPQGLDANEIIGTATRGMFERSGEGKLLDAFMQLHGATRIYYDVFATTQAIHGRLGAHVEFNVVLWDMSPTKLLVEEAGGAYEELRRWKDTKGQTRYSIIFGKPSVVAQVGKHFRA
jgi:histidinol-phosphatase